MEWEEGNEGGWDEPDKKEDNGSEGAVEIENNFYEAEGMLKDNPAEALERFLTVVDFEQQRDAYNYSFNSHKFIIILAAQLG